MVDAIAKIIYDFCCQIRLALEAEFLTPKGVAILERSVLHTVRP